MQASDAIVTRGGTTTCAKALHFRCPIIFNAFQGIMPQEELTWKFFRNGAASNKIENAADFARTAARCATDRAWAADFRANARARMQASALMDSKAYAARFFGALRESWRVRCEQAG